MIEREETSDTVRLTRANFGAIVSRPRVGTVLLRLNGYDAGQLGTSILDEVGAEMRRSGKIELFIDTREASGATWEVSRNWSGWFKTHRDQLARVCILVNSRLVRQTIEVARELSNTGRLITILSDEAQFNRFLEEGEPSKA
jgi:hypothetical protein